MILRPSKWCRWVKAKVFKDRIDRVRTGWMDNIRNNNPGLKVFDLSEGIDLLKSPEEEEEHDHPTTIIIPEASIRIRGALSLERR